MLREVDILCHWEVTHFLPRGRSKCVVYFCPHLHCYKFMQRQRRYLAQWSSITLLWTVWWDRCHVLCTSAHICIVTNLCKGRGDIWNSGAVLLSYELFDGSDVMFFPCFNFITVLFLLLLLWVFLFCFFGSRSTCCSVSFLSQLYKCRFCVKSWRRNHYVNYNMARFAIFVQLIMFEGN